MKKLKRVLKLTEDGSHTFYLPDLDEHYHSTHGAIQEAMHIYLQAGFEATDKNPLRILEIGFGTGLNCFLTALAADRTKRKITYHSIELYPLEQEMIEQLNYAEQVQSNSKILFEELHRADWNIDTKISDFFDLRKLQGDLTQYVFESTYDLIYFDAFAPDVQPELWDQAIFEKLYHSCNSKAILLTYCSKGIVKRALRAAGFEVKRLPGPPGKRQILRATKINNFREENH